MRGRGFWNRPLDNIQAYLACAAMAFSICAFTASRLKLAPFCIGGILDRGLGHLGHFLLHKDEAPELVGEPVVECERAVVAVGQAGALERVETKIDQDRPVDLDRCRRASRPADR